PVFGRLVAGAAAGGLSLAALTQVASFAGLWGGLALGAALAPTVSGTATSPVARSLLAVATVLVVTAVVTGVARTLGARAWHRVRRSSLRRFDAAAGAVVGGAATLLVVWLVASMAARLPAPGLT